MATANHDIKEPLVSIAMCTYNGAAWLPQQLDTLLNQTWQNLEIIICDDASTDHTPALLEEYARKDPRIKIYRNEQNLGYNKNFEKACRLSTGEFIAISDQDDIWEPQKIEAMMKGRDPEAIFWYSLSRNFWGDVPAREEENKPIRYYEGSAPEKLAFDSPIHGHASMFRRSLLEAAVPFPDNVYYDWWLSMVASATGKVSCIPVTYTWHRISGQNTSRVLLDIRAKEERAAKLRAVCLRHTEAFLSRPLGTAEGRRILQRYCQLLLQKKDNRFSWPFFLFFFRNRAITFHYKRKRNVFSMLKNSFKRARTGL